MMDARKMERDELRALIRQSTAGVRGVSVADAYAGQVPRGLRRAGNRRTIDVRSMKLVQDQDGTLLWDPDRMGGRGPGTQRARSYRGAAYQGDVVDHLVIEPLEPSKVQEVLMAADQHLTPGQGLLQWNGTTLTAATGKPAGKGKKVLLVVHGTFSEGAPIFSQLGAADNTFWGVAATQYDRILAFNHPTLAVNPMLNALELSRQLAGEAADIDVICHSRGGLVTQWWLEEFDQAQGAGRRAIFVGAPMEGTSLASPPHLRHLLSWFTNLAGKASDLTGPLTPLIPWMKVVSLLCRLTAVVTTVVGSPLLDAAVALVPGLDAMSRVSNNRQGQSLLGGVARTGIERMIITAEYSPPALGWRFWEYFVPQRALYGLFNGLQNDTVVDVRSMNVFRPKSRVQAYAFARGSTVHHTNYFGQPETAREIRKFLKF